MMAIVTHTRNATSGYVNALPSSRIQLHVTDRSLSAHRMMEMRSASHITQAGIQILFLIQHQALSRVCAMFTNLSGMVHISALQVLGSVEDTT